MQIRNGKDFWAGLMFSGFGLGFLTIAFNYPMGSAGRMGPAYFPTVLGGLLALLGVAIVFRACISQFEHPLKVFAFRLPMLVAAIAVGGATFVASGLLRAMPMAEFALGGLAVMLFIGAFGSRSMFFILAAVMIFGYALKPLGLVIATVLLILISAFGGHDFRKKEVGILTMALVLFALLVFVKALGLPFNIWPGQ